MKQITLKKFGIVVNIDSNLNSDQFGHIYMFKNLVNNKIYIGQSINVIRRIREHLRMREKNSKKLLQMALKKYGFKNFEISIIDFADNMDELNKKERKYVSMYGCDNKKKGYNIAEGGRNAIPSEETIMKMSKAHSGIKQTKEWVEKRIPKKGSEEAKKHGRPKTEEEKKYLREISPKYWEGKTRDEETKRKISETKKANGPSQAQINSYYKTVYVYNSESYELIETYISTGDASNKLNITQSTISRWCSNNKIKNDKIWSYINDIEKIKNLITRKKIEKREKIKMKETINEMKKPLEKSKNKRKKIEQTPDWIKKRIEKVSKTVIKVNKVSGQILEEHSSLANAGRDNGDNLSQTQINRKCLGLSRQDSDIIWCYKEDYENNTLPKYNDNPKIKAHDSFTDDEMQMMLEEYKNGTSLREISRNWEINFSTLQKFVMINKNENNKQGNDYTKVICKKTKIEFSDVLNKSGQLTTHIKETYPDVNLPSKYLRKKVEYETGKPWYFDYFDFI